jgi:tetratricopeptide (TPR) repeat protein
MRRLPATALLLALLLAVLTLAGCNKLKARDELNKGVRAYKGAQFDTAIEHFKRAIEADPQLINARIYLAIAYASRFVPGSPLEENKRMGSAAIEAFQDVLKHDPHNVTSLSYIASLQFGLQDFEKAKESRRRLIEVDANNPEHYYSIGVINWTLTYKPRMELRVKLGLSKPEEPLPRRAREELAAKSDALVNEGIEVLQRALELKPDYADAMAYLNLLYREKADLVASPVEREQLLQQADDLAERAQELMKRAAEGPAPATPR